MIEQEKKAKKKRLIMIAAFGDRGPQVRRLVNNIRKFVDYPIHIITTLDSNLGFPLLLTGVTKFFVDRIWPKGSYREGVRNSNYFKVREALGGRVQEYDSVLMLDDDMFITHPGFIGGFDISEKFGAAIPHNPRIYVAHNAMGADMQQRDIDDLERLGVPPYFPAANFSPFFVSTKHTQARNFLSVLQSELRDNVCRGTIALNKASWATGFSPVLLPQQWCICGGAEARYLRDYTQQLQGRQISIPPMMLHLGHEETKVAFRGIIDEVTNGKQ